MKTMNVEMKYLIRIEAKPLSVWWLNGKRLYTLEQWQIQVAILSNNSTKCFSHKQKIMQMLSEFSLFSDIHHNFSFRCLFTFSTLNQNFNQSNKMYAKYAVIPVAILRKRIIFRVCLSMQQMSAFHCCISNISAHLLTKWECLQQRMAQVCYICYLGHWQGNEREIERIHKVKSQHALSIQRVFRLGVTPKQIAKQYEQQCFCRYQGLRTYPCALSCCVLKTG